MSDSAQVSPEAWAGARFRALRKERGWSQQDLALLMEAFGYSWSQATVTRIEAATRPTRLNEVADLAELFGLKLAGFLAGAPGRPRICLRCGDGPPEGFMCRSCGRSA